MERWLLLSNCQTQGLANSLNLMCPACEVIGIDIWDYRQHLAHYNWGVGEFDRTIILPEVRAVDGGDLSRARKVEEIPGVYFDGYHPDQGYAGYNGEILKGPLSDYQSLIALAAYQIGLGVDDTARLYKGQMYERFGFMQTWLPARQRLFDEFDRYGLDLRDEFARWGSRRSFMYSTNHPRIEVVYDIARKFLRSRGLPIQECDLRPADNLVNGPYFPIYPEIAESVGVEGSILFKPLNSYKFLTLKEFLTASFACYDRYPRGSLDCGGFQKRFEHIRAVIEGTA